VFIVVMSLRCIYRNCSGLQGMSPRRFQRMFLRIYTLRGQELKSRYVEDGLNPDKYTRRFVNMLMKDNQFVNGKIDAVKVRSFGGQQES
jgi:hypothetical protein